MRTTLKSMFAIAAFATLALAADKPNFSGDWTLDAEKSNFGPMPPPASMTMKIDHADPAVTIKQTTTGGAQGDQDVTMKYSTDGKETTNEMMGTPVKSVASWDGKVLLVKMTADFGGAEIQINNRWTLSDDGKVLTNASHIVAPQGEIDLTYVMNKR